MKIYNEAKTRVLENPDLSKGKLVADRLFIARHQAVEEVEEQSHYELIEEFEGAGKVHKNVIDVPYRAPREAYDEYEDIEVYLPFTEKELAEIRIAELKRELLKTDYQAIKYAEGELSAAEYKPMKAQRAAWRAEINRLEEEAK